MRDLRKTSRSGLFNKGVLRHFYNSIYPNIQLTEVFDYTYTPDCIRSYFIEVYMSRYQS